MCRRGCLALLTPKSNPVFDVVAKNADGSSSVSIQVKTRSIHNRQGWKLAAQFAGVSTLPSLFVVLVRLKEDAKIPDFLIYDYATFPDRVNNVYNEYIKKPKRDGQPRKDPGFRWFDEISFADADRARLNNLSPILNALGAS